MPSRPSDPGAVIDQVTESLRATADEVVPWFLEQMPTMYFQDTSPETQLAHIRAITAARASGRPLELTLRSEDGSEWTSMRPLDYPGVLAELVAELPMDQPLRAAKIHTAHDGGLVIDTFEFGETPPFDPEDKEQAAKLEETVKYAATHLPEWDSTTVREYFHCCSADYILTLTALRMCKHWRLCQEVSGTDGTAVAIEKEAADPNHSRIVVAVSNSTRRSMLERIARLLSRSSINIHRAYLDTVLDGSNGSISLLGFVVEGPDGHAVDPDGQLWHRVRRDLLRIKWVDARCIEIDRTHPQLDLTHAELIIALGDLIHQVLVKRNPYAFTSDRIRRLAESNIDLTATISDLLIRRFNPDAPLEDNTFWTEVRRLQQRVEAEVDLEDARIVLLSMIEAITSVLKTNLFLEDRYALSFRLDPRFLEDASRPERPFGVFFVHGRGFNGFHVRFRDIARGGVRVVLPRGTAQFTNEVERLYDAAQQLKNKDIPEGGSKAAVLVHPSSQTTRSAKAFIDAILDLITSDPTTTRRIVDHLGYEELLYLGPDENVNPTLIDWIVDRAEYRGYRMPTALMSSKPGAGINHKEYGVTSEGVCVFLEVGLQSLGINPRTDAFTVKMTGGPDGDVGGNAIKIMFREFGDHAHIVGIADGSGSAECPEGLDHDELMRLVEHSLPISEFDPSKLSANGTVSSLDDADGVRLRNTLHNRIVADAFLPCGGRPNTIHDGNWSEFLLEDGRPSSPLIVEGANLFLTPEARHGLHESGSLIFKDSSANKCGVICSSFEIIASMLLSTDEFLDIKPVFVDEVLNNLRHLAREEAGLLARIYRQQQDLPMPHLCRKISEVMIRTADAIEQSIDGLPAEDWQRLSQVVTQHLPPVLVQTAGDRLMQETPRPYLRWIMAKSLAARMVYREGYASLEAMPVDVIAPLALEFLRIEQRRIELAGLVDDSSIMQSEQISSILRKAGIFSTMDHPTQPDA
ncbi:MAG: NAD-glutamate dehydrogenase [Phycisphaerales bacterium]|nr:NAD-glutamate dehydrogenase [Phycisphaerales bacterium]